MKIISVHRKLGTAIGLTLAAMLFPALASAGCGSFRPGLAMGISSGMAAAQDQAGTDPSGDWHPDGRDPMVGMWKVSFTATDGSGYTDFGYSQWHSDGTEVLNSGSRAPATQNFCLGVWEKGPDSTYKLNHFALSYDQSTGDLNGKVNIREEVKVGKNGDTFSGSFGILIYDPTGKTELMHVEGKITGTRITVNTTMP